MRGGVPLVRQCCGYTCRLCSVHRDSFICRPKNFLSHFLGRFFVPVFFKVGTFGSENGSSKFLAAFPPGLEEERDSFFQMRVKPRPALPAVQGLVSSSNSRSSTQHSALL